MQTSAKRTAVLLDPHPLWLEAVEPILSSIGVEVVGKATSPERALALVEAERPDLVVAEIQTLNGGMSGTAFIRAAREQQASLRVIVLGESADAADIDAAFAAGALAYVVKTAHRDDVAATVRQTFDHSVFLARSSGYQAPPTRRAPDDEVSALTRREREILRLVADGHSNRDLAKMLWVTEQTVKFHLSNIYRKLDVANRTEAARWAHRHGILEEGHVQEVAGAASA